MKSLVIYYSRAGENYFDGEFRHLVKGNTEVVAEKIAMLTHADLFKIEQVHPYSSHYDQSTKEALDDKRNKVRPELTHYLDSIDSYDVIYIGYPNYWGTFPMAVATQLEKLNLQGKTIKPFCTHEGSGMGTSMKDLKTLCVGATLERGLPIHGSRVLESDEQLKGWIIL